MKTIVFLSSQFLPEIRFVCCCENLFCLLLLLLVGALPKDVLELAHGQENEPRHAH
jgi:hypothetical protein